MTADSVLVDTAQGRFYVGAADCGVGGSLRSRGGYGEDEIARAAELCGPDGEALVVGAHVGTIAIPLAKAVRRITMIEANPDTFAMLRRNMALNDVQNAVALELAASDRPETLQFVCNTVNSGGSKRYPKIEDPDYFEDRPRIVEVAADRLDDRLPGASPDLILMDIEGSEYFALQGMPRLLAAAHTLIVEFIPYHLTDVAAVSPEAFGALILRHFERMYVPRMDHTFERPYVLKALRALFDAGESDPGIVFSK